MSAPLQTAPLWKIWANPIFRRYSRSRLRLGALLPWLLLVVIIAAFAFFATYLNDIRIGHSRAAAAADAFFPVLVIQMVILLLMGTGSVASGVITESDDGMTDYQRLTPMDPLAKIVGYLFGLPLREYALFAATLPFTLFSVIAGEMPIGLIGEIYFMLFMSAVLYHLTGCVAGTVVKKRRFAGRAAQIMVVLLYFVLPGLGQIGFVFFEYLTMRPVLIENLGSIHLPLFGNLLDGGPQLRSVYLFDFEFSQIAFSILIQLSLIISFIIVLYRKWRQPTNHLLGKNFAVALFFWIMLLLVGNALPLIANGSIFPSHNRIAAMQIHGMEMPAAQADPMEAYILSALFGLGTLILAFAFIAAITPTADEYTKGLRRARKLGRRRIPFRADGATAVWYTLVIALIGALFWSRFVDAIFHSPFVRDFPHDADLLIAAPLTLLIYLPCFHGITERYGRKTLLIFALFIWIVPLLGSIIMVAAGIDNLPVMLAALSVFAAPFYVLVLSMEDNNLLDEYGLIMQIGIAFALCAHLLLLIYLSWSLARHKRRIRREMIESR